VPPLLAVKRRAYRQSVDPCTSPKTHHAMFRSDVSVAQCKNGPRYRCPPPIRQASVPSLRALLEVSAPPILTTQCCMENAKRFAFDRQPSRASPRFGADYRRCRKKGNAPAGGIIIFNKQKARLESPPPTTRHTKAAVARGQTGRIFSAKPTVIESTAGKHAAFDWAGDKAQLERRDFAR